MSYMGPGFLTFFPVGEAVLGPPVQIPLSLVNYSNIPLKVVNSLTFALNVAQKSEHNLGIIK